MTPRSRACSQPAMQTPLLPRLSVCDIEPDFANAFSFRDPVERFMSCFYSRQNEGDSETLVRGRPVNTIPIDEWAWIVRNFKSM